MKRFLKILIISLQKAFKFTPCYRNIYDICSSEEMKLKFVIPSAKIYSLLMLTISCRKHIASSEQTLAL